MFDKVGSKVKQLGELNKLRSQAMRLKKALSFEEVTVEESGVKVRITGDQKVKEVFVSGEPNKALVNVLNKAIKKSQKMAAKKMQSMEGGLGMFGM